MDNNTVIIKRLDADHEQETFTEFRPLNAAMVKEVDDKVKAIFDSLGGASLIKSSGDVYIKPNGVGEKPYVYTRPEVLKAAIRYWFDAGARNVYLFENCTQATCTRFVFEQIGYNELCEKTGATPIYLDEEETVRFEFSGKPVVAGKFLRRLDLDAVHAGQHQLSFFGKIQIPPDRGQPAPGALPGRPYT